MIKRNHIIRYNNFDSDTESDNESQDEKTQYNHNIHITTDKKKLK